MSALSGGRKLTGRYREMARLQGWMCPLCGERLRGQRAWNVDHIRPRLHGGADGKRNLQITHTECNSYKGSAWDGESGHGKRFGPNREKRCRI